MLTGPYLRGEGYRLNPREIGAENFVVKLNCCKARVRDGMLYKLYVNLLIYNAWDGGITV
jgi:hypothetical protein